MKSNYLKFNYFNHLKIIILILILFSNNLKAQNQAEKKISIAVLKFTYTENFVTDYTPEKRQQEVEALQDRMFSLFSSDKRFVLVDRSKLALIEKERELQKKEDFIDGYVTKQGTAIGADYIITGSYDFRLKTASINIHEVSTGKLMGNETLRETALGNSIRVRLRQQIVNKYFPLSPLRIVRFLTENDRKDEVLMAGGTKDGIKSKERFWVIEQISEEIDGNEVSRNNKIGELKVKHVENENFSVCKIINGEAKIKEKIAQNIKLYCIRANE